jgi:hypothetical protein
VKYLMLIYGNPRTWGHPMFLRTAEAEAMSQTERDEMSAQFEKLLTEIAESGEFVTAQALADPITSRTVRVRDGATLATDGPFAESKEQLAGFFIVDCATPERAEEIAGRFPDARFAAVEMRPLMDVGGQEM